jgi:ArsR family transcriptional regulator
MLADIYTAQRIFDRVKPDLALIAEPCRRLVLALVATEGELCVCELVAALGDPQPSVSRHLALLRDGGWLVYRREGTFVHYRLGPLPAWARQVVDALTNGGVAPGDLRDARRRLSRFAGGPSRPRDAA